MDNLQMELSALKTLQADFRELEATEKKISDVGEQKNAIKEWCLTENKPREPVKDTSRSDALQEKAWNLDENLDRIPIILGFIEAALILIVGIMILLGASSDNGAMALVWAVVVAGSLVGFGFSAGAKGHIIWSVLALLFAGMLAMVFPAGSPILITAIAAILVKIVLWIIIAPISTSIIDRKIKLIRKQEDEAYQKALGAYHLQCVQIEKDNEKKYQSNLDQLDQSESALRKEKLAIQKRIDANPVLATRDKRAEVVDYLVSRIEDKRATSLADALLQYDKMQADIFQHRLETDRRIWENRQRAQREFEESMAQTAHRQKVEAEQRRQGEELERIRKAVED